MKGTMKVAVMNGIGKMGYTTRPIPTPKEDEVLVKLEYVGICGSDMHYYETGAIGNYVVKPPFVLGHEPGGTVVEVGSAVKHLKVGDRVALEPGKTCGHCKFCREGKYNLCPDVVFFATPPVDGVFQEYVAHEANLCFKLPDNVSTMEGALIEPLAVGFHAANQGGAHAGQTAVVMGAGCIGLVSMMALKAEGVSRVYVVDIMQKRLDKALELGADGVINSREKDAVQTILDLTDGLGCDLVIETAGTEITTRQAIEMAQKGANIVLVGYSKSGEMTLPMSLALDKELTFKTVFRYRHIYPMAIDAVASGKINLKGIVTNIFDFDDIQNAMDKSISDKANIVKSSGEDCGGNEGMSFPQVLTGVAHIGIPTNDLDKTIAFYKKLGFVSALETVNKAAGERVAFLQLGDLMIETYENHRAAEKAGAIDHVALATTDIEAAFAAAKEAGMHLLHSSIQSLPFWENGVRFFMVEGPNKERIEFCQKL